MAIQRRRGVGVLGSALELAEVGVGMTALEHDDFPGLQRSEDSLVRLHVLDPNGGRCRPALRVRRADARGDVDDASGPDAVVGRHLVRRHVGRLDLAVFRLVLLLHALGPRVVRIEVESGRRAEVGRGVHVRPGVGVHQVVVDLVRSHPPRVGVGIEHAIGIDVVRHARARPPDRHFLRQ